MPSFRCTDPECGYSWSHNSILDDNPECLECGEPAEIVDPDDDDEVVLERVHAHDVSPTDPRIAYARELARKYIADSGIGEPPVPVFEMAQAEGLEIVLRVSLGSLQGRLVGDTIELVRDDPPVVHRFTVAHELGHRALQHEHGAGAWAETEADNYANELLVPGPLLRDAIAVTTSGAALRKKFWVSRPVLAIACKHHGLGAVLID